MEAAAGTEQEHLQPDRGYEPRSRLRRFIEVTGFWLVYIGLGEAFNVNTSTGRIETYLLLGPPLVVLFQLCVARRDIRELWVRSAPKMVLTRMTIALAAALAIYPIVMLVQSFVNSEPASVPIATLVVIAGAVPAAYAFGHFHSETWRQLALCTVLMVGYTIAVQIIFNGEKVFTHPLEAHPDHDLVVFILSLLQYIPTVFVFEEVVFRGCLDSHLHHPGERRGGWTAAYISLLWCLWHAPMFGWDEATNLIIGMFPAGIVLSIFWRKSGNLGVSGTAHAINDSIRNATVGLP
jgi:membrane protease YdiL (CAAX protease family)